MQISKQALSPKVSKQLFDRLCNMLALAHHPDDVKKILKELLSETERVAIMKRVGIALSLAEGKSYAEIKSRLKVSSATIAMVQEQAAQPGWQIIIEAMKVQASADWMNQAFAKFFSFGRKKR
jgi:Trp operon repressor